MSRVLLVDDAAALAELFAATVRSELGHEVHEVVSVADVETALIGPPFDLAIVDLSFPQEKATGIDALAEIHAAAPATLLVLITQGDRWVADTLRDATDLLPIATVISKSAPLAFQLDMISRVLAGETVPVDPAIATLLPGTDRPHRSIESFSRLVPHLGHAKFWTALLASDERVTYQSVADSTGLKLNTIKNYRSQLLGELRLHGLADAGLLEIQQFAWRCRAFLGPHLDR